MSNTTLVTYSNYETARGRLVIEVLDTGAGISRENQKRLFNEIVQFNPEKLQAGGGSGLGLWITQEILNLHDGSFSVSSEGEGMGSCFTIDLPMLRQCFVAPSIPPLSPLSFHSPLSPFSPLPSTPQRSDALRAVEEIRGRTTDTVSRPRQRPLHTLPTPHSVDSLHPADQSSSNGNGNGNGSRVHPLDVFVVDDSRLNHKMLLNCLRADGHTCYEAVDGLEAVAMVKERIGYENGGHGRPFDAILMDLMMPNMDGPTATRQIRALGYTAPILGVTGNGELPLKCFHCCLCPSLYLYYSKKIFFIQDCPLTLSTL
jgi:CheY-like chemotaxis protein